MRRNSFCVYEHLVFFKTLQDAFKRASEAFCVFTIHLLSAKQHSILLDLWFWGQTNHAEYHFIKTLLDTSACPAGLFFFWTTKLAKTINSLSRYKTILILQQSSYRSWLQETWSGRQEMPAFLMFLQKTPRFSEKRLLWNIFSFMKNLRLFSYISGRVIAQEVIRIWKNR